MSGSITPPSAYRHHNPNGKQANPVQRRINRSREATKNTKHVHFPIQVIETDIKLNSPENITHEKITKVLRFIEKSVLLNLKNPAILLSKLSDAKTLIKRQFGEKSTLYNKIMAKILFQEASACSGDKEKCEKLLEESNQLDPTDDKFSMKYLTVENI